jgi:hypothetical protein
MVIWQCTNGEFLSVFPDKLPEGRDGDATQGFLSVSFITLYKTADTFPSSYVVTYVKREVYSLAKRRRCKKVSTRKEF